MSDYTEWNAKAVAFRLSKELEAIDAQVVMLAAREREVHRELADLSIKVSGVKQGDVLDGKSSNSGKPCRFIVRHIQVDVRDDNSLSVRYLGDKLNKNGEPSTIEAYAFASYLDTIKVK